MIIKRNSIFSSLFFILLILFSTHVMSITAPNVEKIVISEELKEKILRSTLKANLQTTEGKKFVAYLYAVDERIEVIKNSSCITGKEYTTESKLGHYYIYLYDVESKSFLPYRTRVLEDFDELRFNAEGAKINVLSASEEKKSDVLLISQFGHCTGDIYEAYGFSENNLYLKNYYFIDKNNKLSQIYVHIFQYENNLNVYGTHDPVFDIPIKIILRLTDTFGIISVHWEE